MATIERVPARSWFCVLGPVPAAAVCLVAAGRRDGGWRATGTSLAVSHRRFDGR